VVAAHASRMHRSRAAGGRGRWHDSAAGQYSERMCSSAAVTTGSRSSSHSW
jgi:hypothetical protein